MNLHNNNKEQATVDKVMDAVKKAQPHKTEGDGSAIQLLVVLPNYSR